MAMATHQLPDLDVEALLSRAPRVLEAYGVADEEARNAFRIVLTAMRACGHTQVIDNSHGNVKSVRFSAARHPACRFTKSHVALYVDADHWYRLPPRS